MEIYTIGFTQRSAADFFGALKKAGIQRLIDVRLHNTSQLSAFAKRDDLEYFLSEILGAEYVHEPLLAPTDVLLDAYKKAKGSWGTYEEGFLDLMRSRQIERAIDRALFEIPAVMLCSERTAEKCHRRLVAEYLKQHWGDVEIRHL